MHVMMIFSWLKDRQRLIFSSSSLLLSGAHLASLHFTKMPATTDILLDVDDYVILFGINQSRPLFMWFSFSDARGCGEWLSPPCTGMPQESSAHSVCP